MKKHNLNGTWLHHSYIGKVTLASIFLVMIPLAIAMVITGSRINEYLQKSVQQQADQAVASLNVTLEQYFSEIKELTVLPIYDNELQAILSHHVNPEADLYLTFDERRTAAEIFSGLIYEKDTVRQTNVYLKDGYELSASSVVRTWGDDEKEWMNICDENPYETFILPWNDTVALVRTIQEPLTGRELGYIKVELEPWAVGSLIHSSGLPPESEVIIYSQADQLIYPLDSQESQTEDPRDEKSLTGFVTSEETDLKVLVRMSMKAVEKDVRDLFGFAIWIFLIALAGSGLFAFVAAKRLTKPILDLKEKMALVEDGRFNTRMTVQSKDEIGQLEEMFNNMTASIETLIHEVYEESLASKEAQISALQSQINPHFLYNTLETINMMAIGAGNYEVSEAVSTLGQMMHYCVSNEQHFAPLREEIRFVQDYYSIQKLRFENLRSLSVEADTECQNTFIPKLLLQPFVENIMQHGLSTEMLDIVLSARKEGTNDLVIVIQNNGNPMEPEEKQRVIQKLLAVENVPLGEPWKPTGHGYGLVNVHRRLRLLYGEDCGVFLDESYVDGVRFILRLHPKVQ